MPSPNFDPRTRRFLDLPRGERILSLVAWWQLLFASVLLRFRPQPTLAQALAVPARPGPADPTAAVVSGRVARALGHAAAHHLWPMTCLPRALACQRLLARRGIPAALRLGVRKRNGQVEAHAWIEVCGEAIGEPEAIEERFHTLLPSPGASGGESTG